MVTSEGLVFYESSHRYRLDGEWCPGVSSLLNGGLPKELKYWAARSVAEYVADNPEEVETLRRMGRGPMVKALGDVPFQYNEDAKVRGTDVHNLAEQLVDGHDVEVPQKYDGYVQSCVDFLDTWQPKSLVVERPLAHRTHWWAGKPDLFGSLPDGRVILFDYKTGSGIYPETAFQLAAYSHAEFYLGEDGGEHPIPKVDLCAAVWLRPDGYDVVPLKADDEVYKEFRHIAYVAQAARRAKGNRTTVGYVQSPLEAPAWAAA
jgi:hypothetical protein